MGRLVLETTGEVRPIPTPCIVGRSPSAFLRLSGGLASAEHALITWDGASWRVRDLESTNGTFLDRICLRRGASAPLAAGAVLAFGDPEETWRLADASAPELLAIDPTTRRVCAAERGFLALPSAEEPLVTAWIREDGEPVVDVDGEVHRLDAPRPVAAGGTWLIYPPGTLDRTPLASASYALSDVSFHFAVSRDEETVEVTLLHRGRESRLDTRDHAYVLLVLARARAADRDAGKEPDERGWMSRDQLVRALRREPNAVDVAIHRARKQLHEVGLAGAGSIVEVRRGLRRFGTDRFVIARA